ncbi:src-like-adapter 2 isoform X3 [Sphaerodactylus townsendi]|uniref:src-like-adapter 2 isoform X3 n=1 Tax=Sphaerodactylus townsendi TaxID=933632 RepID=UPI002026BC47|nr:src-like-adapter 2 isoform X3 [Sphaerodactylus townsendi]
MIMGSLFSRRKPVPQNHQPTGCGPRHTAIAICNFPPGPAEQILQMGEQLHLLSQNGEWWKVTSVATGRDCYIPSSHIAKITYRWLYDGISREKAEELLMMPSNRDGSFLIRKSQMRKDSQDGLCCRLQEPCFIQGSDSGLLPSLSKPVTVKQSNLNWQEINSSELLSENLLPEDSPISLGLRDAINSYVLVTEDLPLETRSTRKGKKCKDI